VSEKAPGLG